MTDEEKREKQRQRRMARKGVAPDPALIEEFRQDLSKILGSLEEAFHSLARENREGWIKISRGKQQ